MSYTITNEMRRQSVTNFLRIFYIIGKKRVSVVKQALTLYN